MGVKLESVLEPTERRPAPDESPSWKQGPLARTWKPAGILRSRAESSMQSPVNSTDSPESSGDGEDAEYTELQRKCNLVLPFHEKKKTFASEQELR